MFILGISAFSAYVAHAPQKEEATAPDYFADAEAFYAFWEEDIEKSGTADGYQHFRAAYSGIRPELKHTVGHAFAELLYAAEGLAAMTVCDNDYSYSCFHEIVTATITEKGMGFLEEINALCNEKVWCQHGIGHGLIKLSGYNKDGLHNAIAACETIPWYDPIDGCLGGVFMEFYTYRSTDEMDTAMEPCEEVVEVARASCFFWLGQWFLSNPPDGEVFARFSYAAHRCSEIIELEYRLQCYKRIGYDTGNYSTDARIARSYCEKSIPPGDAYFEVQCKAAAAAMFYSYEHMRPDAESLCEGLTGDRMEYCMYASDELPYTHDRRIENYGSVI